MAKNLNRILFLAWLIHSCWSTAVSAQESPANQIGTRTAVADVKTDAVQELGSIVQRYVDSDYSIGGELLIIEKGETQYHQSFGFSDREKNEKWKNNTPCNIRSMTKPITSAAAQILIDRGKLKLDEPVCSYLESFDNDRSRPITVRQVLTHRSGLPLTNLMRPDQYPSLAEQVAAAGKNGPQFEPGSKFWYSDTGTDVVGRLVEKTSGELLHKFVQREILDPLGMKDTFYGFDSDDERLGATASSYMKNQKLGWVKFWSPDKPLYPFAWGSQTLYSTTTDYARFLKMMINNGRFEDRQILSVEAVQRMLAPVSSMKSLGSDKDYPTGFRNVKTFYGQMMLTHRTDKDAKPLVIGHSGSDGTNAWAWPEKDLIILYFTQSRGGRTVIQIEQPIDRLLINPADEDTPVALKPYLGKFIANFKQFDNEVFTVFVHKGRLTIDVPSQTEFELMAPDENGFWAFARMPDKIQATFEKNDKDEIISIKLHQAGQIFEVPRIGTQLAKEQAKERIAKIEAKKEAKSREKLKEAWIGAIDLGGVKPVMQFRIVKTDSGKEVVYFDSVTEGQTDFAATWSIIDDEISFDVKAIQLTYRGKLNDTKNEAEGTWSQGGRSLPLRLKKQNQPYEK